MSNSKCDTTTFVVVPVSENPMPGQFFSVGSQNNWINQKAQQSVYYSKNPADGYTTMRFSTVTKAQEAARILARIGCDVLLNSQRRTIKVRAVKRDD